MQARRRVIMCTRIYDCSLEGFCAPSLRTKYSLHSSFLIILEKDGVKVKNFTIQLYVIYIWQYLKKKIITPISSPANWSYKYLLCISTITHGVKGCCILSYILHTYCNPPESHITIMHTQPILAAVQTAVKELFENTGDPWHPVSMFKI